MRALSRRSTVAGVYRAAIAIALLLATACSPNDPAAETSSTTSSSSTGDTTGEPCPVGALGCACTPGGGCDAGLACELDVCAEGCALGSLGCACTEGGSCDDGLACGDDNLCVEGVSKTCGDGVVDQFEDCDAGTDNGDDKACTASCKAAVCGDGLVGPGEACDGSEGCTPGCSLASCGNGQLDPGEECEPAGEEDPECSAICTDARKIIFVTSEHYKGGEIGGVAGGDEKCQTLAEAAGLKGEFKAWLATSKEDAPAVRFRWFEGPYVDVNGGSLAQNGDMLFGGLVKAPSMTEFGEVSMPTDFFCFVGNYANAWASNAYDAGGPAVTPVHCSGWSDVAAEGGVAQIDGHLEAPCTKPCDLMAPIFCVEQ